MHDVLASQQQRLDCPVMSCITFSITTSQLALKATHAHMYTVHTESHYTLHHETLSNADRFWKLFHRQTYQ